MSFDATSRESCTVRRLRTNTPLQALTLLNDPVYLMAAKSLAKQMIAMKDKSEADKILFGFQSIMVRKPGAPELKRLELLLEEEEAKYKADPGEAAKLLDVKTPTPNLADSAAYTIVAQVMFNLDEAITKE